jgi:hypothetical protein
MILMPPVTRRVVEVLVMTEHRLSITRAGSATCLPRAAHSKVSPTPQERDAELIDAF